LFDFLIPVLVTGIQPGQVLGLERLFRAADAALLDPCDEHRDEVERVRSSARFITVKIARRRGGPQVTPVYHVPLRLDARMET
jgi:hypothetical protein